MIWINKKFIKIIIKKRWTDSFYFKYSIKMFLYDIILEVDYINT